MPRVELANGHSVATLQAHTKSAAPRASNLQIACYNLRYVDNSSLHLPLKFQRKRPRIMGRAPSKKTYVPTSHAPTSSAFFISSRLALHTP